jgi:hypothetical protein
VNDHDFSPRLTAMRDALIAEVDSTDPARARRSRKSPANRGTVLAIVGAFVLGAGVTGGVTAAALPGVTADSALESALATSTRYMVEETNHGTLVGTPAFRATSGDETFSLGAPPRDADRLAVTWECLGRGDFTVTIAGQSVQASTDCRSGALGTGSAVWDMVPASGHPVVTVSGGGSARYAVWLSWAKSASVATPSAQQVAETADGVVTLDEYTAAFGRLQACMAQAGEPMGDVPLSWYSDGAWTSQAVGTGPWYFYSVTSDTAVFDTQCYPREFSDVDSLWQTEHPMPQDPPAQP